MPADYISTFFFPFPPGIIGNLDRKTAYGDRFTWTQQIFGEMLSCPLPTFHCSFLTPVNTDAAPSLPVSPPVVFLMDCSPLCLQKDLLNEEEEDVQLSSATTTSSHSQTSQRGVNLYQKHMDLRVEPCPEQLGTAIGRLAFQCLHQRAKRRPPMTEVNEVKVESGLFGLFPQKRQLLVWVGLEFTSLDFNSAKPRKSLGNWDTWETMGKFLPLASFTFMK